MPYRRPTHRAKPLESTLALRLEVARGRRRVGGQVNTHLLAVRDKGKVWACRFASVRGVSWDELLAEILDMIAELMHGLAQVVRTHTRTVDGGSRRASGGADKAAGDSGEYRLLIEYATGIYNYPPYQVTLRTNRSGWQDVTMERVDSPGTTAWTAEIRTDRSERIEFKFVLAGDHWMAGANQVGYTSDPPSVMRFDDDLVHWE